MCMYIRIFIHKVCVIETQLHEIPNASDITHLKKSIRLSNNTANVSNSIRIQ